MTTEELVNVLRDEFLLEEAAEFVERQAKALEEAEKALDKCLNSFSGETDAMRFNHAERALAIILAARGEGKDGE